MKCTHFAMRFVHDIIIVTQNGVVCLYSGLCDSKTANECILIIAIHAYIRTYVHAIGGACGS